MTNKEIRVKGRADGMRLWSAYTTVLTVQSGMAGHDHVAAHRVKELNVAITAQDLLGKQRLDVHLTMLTRKPHEIVADRRNINPMRSGTRQQGQSLEIICVEQSSNPLCVRLAEFINRRLLKRRFLVARSSTLKSTTLSICWLGTFSAFVPKWCIETHWVAGLIV